MHDAVYHHDGLSLRCSPLRGVSSNHLLRRLCVRQDPRGGLIPAVRPRGRRRGSQPQEPRHSGRQPGVLCTSWHGIFTEDMAPSQTLDQLQKTWHICARFSWPMDIPTVSLFLKFYAAFNSFAVVFFDSKRTCFLFEVFFF